MNKAELYELRALVVYSRTNPRIGKELEGIIKPLMEKFTKAAEKLSDPVMKQIVTAYYTNVPAKQMRQKLGLNYNERHIMRIVELAEGIIINEQ